MFERYTEQARRAIFFARHEAVFQPAETIKTGHLLVGLMRERDSRAVVIAPLKENETAIREALGIPPPTSEVWPDRDIKLPLDSNSKLVLTYAVQEAELDKEYWIDTDHLLRGLLKSPNETMAVLQSISLNLDKARNASKRNRVESPSKPPPKFLFFYKHFTIPFRKLRYSIKAQIFLAAFVLLSLLLILWTN